MMLDKFLVETLFGVAVNFHRSWAPLLSALVVSMDVPVTGAEIEVE